MSTQLSLLESDIIYYANLFGVSEDEIRKIANKKTIVNIAELKAEVIAVKKVAVATKIIDNAQKTWANTVFQESLLNEGTHAEVLIKLTEIGDKIVADYGLTNALKVPFSSGNWDLDKAIKFVQRQTIIENMLTQQINALKEFKHNLVKINFNSIASPLCINRQNKVYWVFEQEGSYTALDPELFKNGGGLFHVWCRHFIVAYFKGVTEPPKSPVDKEAVAKGYEKDQEWKYYKRNKQKYWKRMKQARLNGDIVSYNRNKKYYKKWLQAEKSAKM